MEHGRKGILRPVRLKGVKPNFKAKLRIFRIHRFCTWKMLGVERTWKGWTEGEGLLKLFVAEEEAQQEVAKLRSQSWQNPPYEYELQHVPGLPDEIYAITPDEN